MNDNDSEISEREQIRLVLAAVAMHAMLGRDLAYVPKDAAEVAVKYADALLGSLKGNPP